MPILHDAAGRTCQLTVLETNGARYLLLNGCEEGAMRLATEEPVFHYLWFHKCSVLGKCPVRRALVLGAGAFTAPKCLALDHPEADIDAVDLEPELQPLARTYFRLDQPAFARVRFHGVPAEQFLADEREPYDFIFDDLFDGFQHVPDTARTPEHIKRLGAVLAEAGVCVKNLIWDPRSLATQAACTATAAAWRETFPRHVQIALGHPPAGHNLLLLGTRACQPFDEPLIGRCLSAAGLPEYVNYRFLSQRLIG
jgi:spermidine synthase